MTAGTSRLEVITRSERRRRYSLAEKRRIVGECEMPGNSVASVARRHDISQSVVFGWRSMARKGRLGTQKDALMSANPLSLSKPQDEATSTGFIQIAGVQVDPMTIRASLADGTKLDFPVDLDPTRIAMIIRCLRGMPCQ